jgi:hypothetical protein
LPQQSHIWSDLYFPHCPQDLFLPIIVFGVIVPLSGRHKRIETGKKGNNYLCLFSNAQFFRSKMYTKDARISKPGFGSCSSVELLRKRDFFSVHVKRSRNSFFDGSRNCNKLLPVVIGSLFDSPISFHVKPGRIQFSEKLCFYGRLGDGHSIGNPKYYCRPAKRKTLSEGFRTTWILQIKSCAFIYFV